jgi:hypothetical protein
MKNSATGELQSRRRQPGDRRADWLAAASNHAQLRRISRRARLCHLGDGRGVQHFLATNQVDLDIHGFDSAGLPGSLNAVRHFDMPNDLPSEIIDARPLHYRLSSVAGVVLGRKVAALDLRHAFQPID